MMNNRKYTVSQVVNGYIITPDYKENLNREDIRVFNKFENMTEYLQEKFEEDLDKTAVDAYADKITERDHKHLKKVKENMSWVDDKIYGVGLSTRTYNALVANGIHTIKELLAYSDDELIKFKNLGRFSVREIRQRLETYQYKWKEEHA